MEVTLARALESLAHSIEHLEERLSKQEQRTDSEPPGAQVMVDGRELPGVTPITVQVEPETPLLRALRGETLSTDELAARLRCSASEVARMAWHNNLTDRERPDDIRADVREHMYLPVYPHYA